MRRSLMAAAALTLMALASTAQAGVHRWTPVGPEGGGVRQVLAVPGVAGSVWALVEGRPFRSSDGGATWVERSAGLPHPEATYWPAEQLLLDPSQPGTLLAAREGAELYRSIDDGGSWSRILEGSSLGSDFSMAGSPSAPGTFYVSPQVASLPTLRSTDHGATWAPSGVPPGGFLDSVAGFAVDPAAPNRLYVAISRGGTHPHREFIVSNNAGATWVRRGAGLSSEFYGWNLFVTPTQPATLWLYDPGTGLVRSTDAGATWSKPGLGNVYFTPVAFDPNDPSIVYAVDEIAFPKLSFFRSADGGGTWDEIDLRTPHLPNVHFASLAVDPLDAAHLWLGTGFGMLDSRDLGVHWTHASRGLPRRRAVCALAAAPGGTTLHAIADGGLWTSVDAGQTWFPNTPELSSSSPVPTATQVTIDPTDPDVVYVASPDGVFKSIDGGGTWASSSAGLPASGAKMVAVDPSAPLTLYATTTSGLYRSVDGGAAWAPRGPGDFSTVLVDPTLSTTLYLDGGLAISEDGGLTTSTPDLFAPPGLLLVSARATVAPAPTSPGLVYAGIAASYYDGMDFIGVAGLHVSFDRLATTTEISAIGPWVLAVDSSDPLHLYVSEYDRVRRSRDGGASLEPFVAGLRGVTCALAGGNAGEPLYAGTQSFDGGSPAQGIYVIEDPTCAADADCDDGSGCTIDACDAGRCEYTALADGTSCENAESECAEPGTCFAGRCRVGVICNDGDACTSDRCTLPDVCQHIPWPGCCPTPSPCDDGDACTIDQCFPEGCSHTPIADCCSGPEECDDGDACTTDQCQSSTNRCLSTFDTALCNDRRVRSARIRIDAQSGGSKISFRSSDSALLVPSPGGDDDPSIGGATIELFVPGKPPQVVTVPAGEGLPGWNVQPGGPLIYRYENPLAPGIASAVRDVKLYRRPKLSLTALPTEASLADGGIQSLGIRITMGSVRMCALFGGSSIRVDRPGRFIAKGSTLPAGGCSAASLGGS